MAKKTHPENVIPQLLEAAIQTGKERTALFSEYIRLHWRTTGKLAPGVNAADFYAALDICDAELRVQTERRLGDKLNTNLVEDDRGRVLQSSTPDTAPKSVVR